MKALMLLLAALPLAASAAVETTKDIPYRTGADALPECVLDVKVPQGVTGFPTVVWFHGGGLVSGKKNFVKIKDDIAQVAVNYRLLKKDGVTEDGEKCIDDAAAATAWALSHIAEFGGDPKKVFLSGMSAGGYLTMMVGMAPKYLAKYGFSPNDLAGLAPISGQATKHFNVRARSGDTDPQYMPKIDALAPLAWVGKDFPPIVSICGQPSYEWKCCSEENKLLIASCEDRKSVV